MPSPFSSLASGSSRTLAVLLCGAFSCLAFAPPASARLDAATGVPGARGADADGASAVISAEAAPQAASTPDDPEAVTAAKAARAALTAGRGADAVRLADEALAKHAASRELTLVKIEALVATGKFDEALRAYDTRLRLTSQDDREMLRVLGKAELWRAAKGTRASVAAEALEALVSSGDAAAKKELQKQAAAGAASGSGWSAVEALARLGDPAAITGFLAEANKLTDSRRIDALGSVAKFRGAKGPAVEAFIRKSLDTGDDAVQGAAAETAGTLGLTALLPDLQKRYAAAPPMARFPFTVGMARLGDGPARERLRGGLQSPAVSVRLQAAAVLRDLGEQSWVEAVRPVMADSDKLNAVLAAELMLAIDHPAAWKTLVTATVDPNPVMRTEASRIMSADPKGDRPFLRAFLSDEAVQVRLPAARALAGGTASPGGQSSK